MSEQSHSGEATTRPVVLAVGGIDPGGGAGILADLRTIHAHRCWPTAVPTAHTVQTYGRVSRWEAADGRLFSEQLDAVFEDHRVASIKVGMLPTPELVTRLGDILRGSAIGIPVVLDPVLRASSGSSLVSPGALAESVRSLLPLLTVVTPNRAEAERLSGQPEGTEREAMARKLVDMGVSAVVITGGHAEGGEIENFWLGPGGGRLFHARSIVSDRTHGTGCLFASAIAARIARGSNPEAAAESAHHWVSRCVASAQPFKTLGGAPNPLHEIPGEESR